MIEYKVLLKKRIKAYGEHFHVELREYRPDYFQLVNVFSNCEHDRGTPYRTLEDGIYSFEDACGVSLTEEMKSYLKK